MTSGLDKLDWQARIGPAAPLRSLLRDPARILAAAGGLLMIVGCFQAWAIGTDGRGLRVAFGANDGTADGVFIIVAALIIITMTLNRGAAETRSRTLQVAPFVASLVAAVIWYGGMRSSSFAIEGWIESGGSGAHAIGLWLAIGGIVAAAMGSLWVYLRRPADIRAGTPSFREEWDLSRRGMSEAVAGSLGAAAGAVAGLGVAVAVAGTFGVLLMIILCAAGFIFGMQLGILLVRLVTRVTSRR